MDQSQNQILQERLKELPKELKEYLASDELQRRIDLLAKKHGMDAKQQTVLENEIGIVLMVLDSTNHLAKNLQEGLESDPGNAELLARDVEDYIFKKVHKFLAHSDDDITIETEKTVIKNSDHPDKEQILKEIEKPFKTVITKYVIEYDHQPMKDASHLIEDTVDERPKLEDHYEI